MRRWRQIWISEPDLGSDRRWTSAFQCSAIGVLGVTAISYNLSVDSWGVSYAAAIASAMLMFWIGLHLDLDVRSAGHGRAIRIEMRAADDAKAKRVAQLFLALCLVSPAVMVSTVMVKTEPKTCVPGLDVPLAGVMVVAMLVSGVSLYLVGAGLALRTALHAFSHDVWPPPGYHGVREWPVLRGRSLSLFRVVVPLVGMAAIAMAVYLFWSFEKFWAMSEAYGRLNCS